MIKVENIDVYGFNNAIRGMRNPMNSWDKLDTKVKAASPYCEIGPNDLDLMKRLYKLGTEHRKYLRQIFVYMDIVAPLYWWKEFDTYKIGTVSNSCSTMHKIHAKEFTLDDFSHEHLILPTIKVLEHVINELNIYRDIFIKSKNKNAWWQMIQLLPTSYNQHRTVTMNYENVMSMIKQRENHKLDCWKDFCKILLDLPYVKEIRNE